SRYQLRLLVCGGGSSALRGDCPLVQSISSHPCQVSATGCERTVPRVGLAKKLAEGVTNQRISCLKEVRAQQGPAARRQSILDHLQKRLIQAPPATVLWYTHGFSSSSRPDLRSGHTAKTCAGL